ncbi:MAG: Endoribonuclease L-PSP [Chloroflexi bacterium ADurb.Bin325]|nr:MAG: Endoribonuclease L-PSP [Chloroflexi bacterium ADurb.Bin325]
MSRIAERLKELGIELPPVPPPGGNYVPAVQTGNLLYTSGNGPLGVARPQGRVGADLTIEEGYAAARQCALNCLAGAQSVIGDLDRISRVVKVLGFVNAAAGFDAHPKVINGASDVLVEIFGDAGRHARSAVGLDVPFNFAAEVEIIFELRP